MRMTGRVGVSRVIVVGALAAGLAAPAGAAAAPVWVPSPGSVPTGGAALANNAAGDVVVSGQGVAPRNGGGTPLQVRRRLAGGILEEGRFPAVPDGDITTTPASSFLTPDGSAITAYAPYAGGAEPGEGYGRPVSWVSGEGLPWGLRDDIGLGEGPVTLEGDATGSLTAVGRLGGASAVVAWSGGWLTPRPTPAGAAFPALAVGGAGVSTLVWAGADEHLRTASATLLTGGFGPTTDLGPGEAGGKLVAGADGSAAYVWNEPGASGSGGRLVSVLRDGSGHWSAPTTVPGGATAAGVSDYDVAIDGGGLATVVWVRGSSGTRTVLAAQGRAGTGFGAPSTLHQTDDVASGTPTVAVGANAKGDVVAVVGTYVFGDYRAAGYARSPGTAWAGSLFSMRPGPRPVQTAGEVVVDEQGNAAATVSGDVSDRSSSSDLYGFDAAGPRLDGLGIPASTEVGRPLGIDGEATDVWSDVASLTWDFGDGTAAVTGAHPTHAYATRGTKTITVTGRDTVGNTSTRTHTIRVTDRSRPIVDDLRVDPVVLDPAKGAVLRGELGADIHGSLELFRLDGTKLRPVSTLALGLPAGTLALSLRGSLAQQLGAGVYVLLLTPGTPAGANAAATLFVVR